MNSEQITCFISLGTTLSFTKTAEKLFISQSSVSKKIDALESELGFLLFKRNKRSVILTENGKKMLSFFKRFTQEFNEEKEASLARIHREEGIIRIGVIEGYNISSYIASFQNSCSFLECSIDFDRIDILMQKLQEEDFDIIIGQYKGMLQSQDLAHLNNIHVEPLKEIKRIIYFAKSNPLSNLSPLSIKDFEHQPFYIGRSKVALQNAQYICEQEHIKPEFRPTLHQSTIEFKVSSGNGFALGDDFSRIKKDNDFAYIYIPYKQIVGYAYKEGISSKKKHYIKEIVDIFQKE